MIEEYGVEEYLLDIQEDLQNKEYRPKPVKSYGKVTAGQPGSAWRTRLRHPLSRGYAGGFMPSSMGN